MSIGKLEGRVAVAIADEEMPSTRGVRDTTLTPRLTPPMQLTFTRWSMA